MRVLVSTRGLASLPMARGEVRRRAERMLSVMRLEDVELSVLLCDDRTIGALNRRFRGKNRPTDVLAFPLRDEGGPVPAGGAGSPGLLGDVVLSVPTARRQARQHRQTIAAELTQLMAHGLLHLLGYDHAEPAEERRMRAMTDVLVAAARPARGARM